MNIKQHEQEYFHIEKEQVYAMLLAILIVFLISILIFGSINIYQNIKNAAYQEGRNSGLNIVIDSIQEGDCEKPFKVVSNDDEVTFNIKCPEPIRFASNPYYPISSRMLMNITTGEIKI